MRGCPQLQPGRQRAHRTVLLALVSAAASLVAQAQVVNLEVGAGCSFSNIQAAVNAIPAVPAVAYVVTVRSGQYAPFSVAGKKTAADKFIRIEAVDPEVVLDGRDEIKIGISCSANYVTIQGFTLKRFTYAGIFVGNAKVFHACRITGNRLHDCARSIYYCNTDKLSDVYIANNFIERGAGGGIVVSGAWGAALVNNTVCFKSSAGIHIKGNSGRAVVKNNILAFNYYDGQIVVEQSAAADIISDYNGFFTFPAAQKAWHTQAVTGSFDGRRCRDLKDWQAFSGQDQHSISADPLFCEMDFRKGGQVINPHVKSVAGVLVNGAWVRADTDSPCLDAGDPAFDFRQETEPNGGRINLGAFGNTPDASRSVPRVTGAAEKEVP